jgi:putative RNA 2'-phosphotransferase
LLTKCAEAGKSIDRALLEHIVRTNDKKRFTFSDDGTRIRAAQGHSIEVALGLPPVTPPAILYHGTAARFLFSIRSEGLRPGNRQHVHLSGDETTALVVGRRHGEPHVLRIAAGVMHEHGIEFFLADNGVWLTDHVPVEFIEF